MLSRALGRYLSKKLLGCLVPVIAEYRD